MDSFEIQRCGEPNCLRVLSVPDAENSDASGELKEKVFAMQGIVSKFEFIVPHV